MCNESKETNGGSKPTHLIRNSFMDVHTVLELLSNSCAVPGPFIYVCVCSLHRYNVCMVRTRVCTSHLRSLPSTTLTIML